MCGTAVLLLVMPGVKYWMSDVTDVRSVHIVGWGVQA